MRLIDTDAVIKAIDKHTFDTDDGLCLDDDITCILEDVPTIEERKTGKWIHMGGDEWYCDQCGNVISTEGSWEHPLSDERKMYHCNICGADMRGGKGERNEN